MKEKISNPHWKRIQLKDHNLSQWIYSLKSVTSLSLYLSLSLSLSLLLPLSLSLATSSPQHVCTSPPTILKCRESPTKLYKSFSFPCVYHLFPPDLLFSLREFNSDHSALWYFSFYLYIIVLKFIIPTFTFLWRNFHAVMLLFFLVSWLYQRTRRAVLDAKWCSKFNS